MELTKNKRNSKLVIVVILVYIKDTVTVIVIIIFIKNAVIVIILVFIIRNSIAVGILFVHINLGLYLNQSQGEEEESKEESYSPHIRNVSCRVNLRSGRNW